MAVDGKELSDTLRLGSEDWIEYPCTPCAKDGKNVASIKHCVECTKNLCKLCLTFHDKFTSGHRILDKPCSQTGQKKPEPPVQRCDKHDGKMVDLYCPGHDDVGCATCVAVDHSSCKGIQYISDVVISSLIANEISELESRMKQLLIQLENMKHDKQDRLKQLQKEKNDILQEIMDLRKKFNDRLDQMEKTLVSDVESRFAGKIQTSIHLVETVSNMTLSVEKSQRTLQEARNINDAEMFVQLKQGNEILRQNESRLKQLSSDGEMQSIKLLPSGTRYVLFNEKDNLTKDNIFGRISEIIIPRSIEHIGDFDVSLESDEDTSDIGDFLLLNDGSIVFADYGNNQLKKLDSSYNVIEQIDLPDSPSCLCEIDSAQLAVTLINAKKIQFVSQKLHKLGRSFPVGDCCRGIDFLEGQIYVCCGGYENEGPGHIEVYDMNGGLIRTFYEGLSCPFYIKAVSDGELFVADGYSSKMFKVNTRHFSLSEIQIKTVSYVNGFCRLGDGQLCIAGFKSNNVVLVSEDGERQQELLTEEDDIENACAVCFDEKQSRLIISSVESDDIQVFRVVY